MNPKVLHALYRLDLSSFIAKCFYIVSPGGEFKPNWHIDLIADKLEQVTNGHIKRLIINMPPRHLKSICVSVAWPAWVIGNRPHARIMAASYSQILSIKHSLDCRLVMNSPWYQALFPEVQLCADQNAKTKFTTHARGFRFATSVGGTATGEGGDFLIVDDPHNQTHIASHRLRQKTINWFEQAYASRLNNKQTGAIVIVMQRLHEQDLTGYLHKKMGDIWEIVTLPAIATERKLIQVKKQVITREIGDLLHQSRESQEIIEQTQLELGCYAFAAQYQQTPIPVEGTMLQPEWLQCYTALPPKLCNITQSWDTAIKAKGENDYTVCTTWGEAENGYYLLDVLRLRMEYPELKNSLLRHYHKWQVSYILIEDKASGQSLIQDLRRETKLPVIAIKPMQDKLTRFASVTPLFEAGKIFLPQTASWLESYKTELLTFPLSNHDDQVDASSQYLNYVKLKRTGGVRIRQL
jgi:predicted phage terminase large subunit-like protein